jgi:hypothetical protein
MVRPQECRRYSNAKQRELSNTGSTAIPTARSSCHQIRLGGLILEISARHKSNTALTTTAATTTLRRDASIARSASNLSRRCSGV